MKALLLIDIQSGLTERNLYQRDAFFTRINQAITTFRNAGDMIIFVRHENAQLVKGSAAWQIDAQINADIQDYYFGKTHANAFSNKEIIRLLKDHDISEVVIGGLVSHGCVAYTCTGAVEMGLNTSLLNSGHTCWNKDADAKILQTETKLSELGIKII